MSSQYHVVVLEGDNPIRPVYSFPVENNTHQVGELCEITVFPYWAGSALAPVPVSAMWSSVSRDGDVKVAHADFGRFQAVGFGHFATVYDSHDPSTIVQMLRWVQNHPAEAASRAALEELVEKAKAAK